MKGIVFNLLEQIVSAKFGDDTWDTLLKQAKVSGIYTSLGSYPDDDLNRLVEAASKLLSVPAQEVLRLAGREALPLLAMRYPQFFSPHKSTREFVLTLNSIIHPEVRKLYPGADVPEFEFDTSRQDVLVMVYRSARRMCAFAEGLIEGAGVQYQESVTIEQPKCMLRGDSECEMHLRFAA